MTGVVVVSPSGCKGGGGGGGGVGKKRGGGGAEEERERERQQLSVLEVLLAAVRRSVVACRVEREGSGGGWGEEGEAEAEEDAAAAAAASAGWRLGGRRTCATWRTSPSTGSMASSASRRVRGRDAMPRPQR